MANPLPTDAAFSALELELGISLDRSARESVCAYAALLAKWGRKFSLTTVKDPEELLRFHFFESFWAAQRFLGPRDRIADVGSGAGFPGAAIQLFQPWRKTTLIERNGKKAAFLKELCRRLSLDASVCCGPASDYPHWERVDVAAFRALRPEPDFLEIARRRGLQLLVFGGREEPMPGPCWRRRDSALYPASRNRRVTLWAPA
ncbi:MAG TPA: RsmG family class I SAM-dependent methyltransferase [Acidobacteriota bacterium]|nr:RsmG family class I SAM-dependent methyltransferase [Acidobacteriota bacterium]